MSIVVLSPHRDDAAFSCGILLRELVASRVAVTIVNVCTVSDYAPYLALDQTDRVQQVTAARAGEDAAFAISLAEDANREGDSVTFVDLQWKDAPLRWNMATERVLDTVPERAAEIATLKTSLQLLPAADLVLAPRALGGHVDHVLVREAARAAFPGNKLLFYEDLPYACRMTVHERHAEALRHCLGALALHVPNHNEARGVKRKYASCYPSQIAQEVAEEMESYATSLGGRERFFSTPQIAEKLRGILRQDGTDA